MTESDKPDPVDKLVDAYEHMLKHASETIEETEKEAVPALRELLNKAREHLVEFGEITREEAVKVAEYVERDIQDAATYLAETGDDLKAWWRFDLDLIEGRLRDAFSRVADQTSLELQNWAEQARQASLFQAGEVTGPGTLACLSCGAEMHLHKAGRIPPCPKCQALSFKRATTLEDAGE